MRRRRLLQLTTGCGMVTLAGCFSGTPAGPSTESGTAERATPTPSRTPTPTGSPSLTSPIESFWAAYNAADADAMRATVHPNAPTPLPETISFGGNVTGERTTVTERTDDAATVEVVATLDREAGAETRNHTYELRRYDGAWRIWAYDFGDTRRPSPPQVQFEFEYDDAATDDPDTGVIAVTHAGGDSIDAARLRVRGTGITAPDGTDADVTAPDTTWLDATGVSTVTAGTELTVGVGHDATVTLVWTAEDGGSSAVLAQYDGPLS